MAPKTPWMPFYVNDWFGSMTRGIMTPAQRAGYLELLFHQWGSKEGALPNDERALGALSGLAGEWESSKDVILPCFPPHPTLEGYVANPRCTELIEEKRAKSKKNSESGKKGSDARWGGKDDIANANDSIANANDINKNAIVSPSKKNGQSESESESESKLKAEAESSEASCVEPRQAEDTTLSIYEFPTTGKGTKTWTLPQAKLDEYHEAYPALDVETEIVQARQWIRDNLTRRKTPTGMLAFLTRWINKAQNSGRGNRGGNTKQREPFDAAKLLKHGGLGNE